MNNKIMRGCMLVATISFLLMGFIYNSKADSYNGISVSTGVMIDGDYSEIDSGKIGENREKFESFSTGGTIFYICAGVTGIIYIILSVKQKKRK